MNKIAILFAILAVASAAVQTNTPSSAFAIAPGKVFTNVTDAAFTALVGDCEFNGGFDNTTNYIWCQTVAATATVPYTFQRRAINASSPGTVNSTLDTKLATTHMLRETGVTTCSGPGYFGIASDVVASGVYNLYFSYAAVNASSFTKVALTANTAAGLYAVPQACMYDNKIFYIVYMTYVAANESLNAVYVQAVNVTSGAVYYNSTGGVKLFDYTAQDISTYITITGLVGNNKTGASTSGLLLYTNSYSATPATVLSSYNVLPFTLATGAAGSLQTLATGAKTTLTGTTGVSYSSTSTITTSSSTALTTYTTTIYSPQTTNVASTTIILDAATATTTTLTTDTTILNVGTLSYTTQYGTVLLSIAAGGSTQTILNSVTSTQTDTATTAVSTLYVTGSSLSSTSMSGTLTSTISTTYMLSAFGALSTYGVVLVQDVATSSTQQSLDVAHVYTNSFYYNGSTTASTATNYSNPSGYHLQGVVGFSTSDGFALVEVLGSNTAGSNAYYLDQYFYNGTNKVTATSLGTFGSGLQLFPDATGSIWGGYTTDDTINGVNTLAAGYAGEILYIAGASTLSSIFAALIVMIAALFAF